jgi:hypothetical protein
VSIEAKYKPNWCMYTNEGVRCLDGWYCLADVTCTAKHTVTERSENSMKKLNLPSHSCNLEIAPVPTRCMPLLHVLLLTALFYWNLIFNDVHMCYPMCCQ